MANDITAEEFAKWLSPQDAYNLVSQSTTNTSIAASILTRLKGGRIRAAAEEFSRHNTDHEIVEDGVYFEIPPEHWSFIASEAFWSSNDVEFHLPDIYHDVTSQVEIVRCFTIRFDPDGVAKFVASQPKKTTALPAPSSVSTAEKHPGGAPRKEFWDDLWAAIGAQLYNGDLKPKKQADIEEAMLVWAVANSETLAEATARRRASKLWRLIKGS